ncbi:helix-turn-helix transcriptional regulator [Micromonospora sp. DR5-3]|uniref:helix-turn-helix transcriptional regulator n=1 Tax=unclassified Micromonospora TaxID=2617518 RepID=UPI0011D5252B|nr:MULTISPECIES: helix-turn-helix transcriptional regulator [unclassified Micromonospora]MCW3818555.1 helix-turn-helix transcriptional regulator [Micromonospora sp. DR5-3]TYC20274.1 PadR family transcriptional regulator [Micromonospora sp. MP36]
MDGRELRGLLHPFLLLLIFERPAHGYDLIDRLRAMGVPDVEPGHVYRVLRGLERDRSLISMWETTGAGPARRCYELTAKGRDDLRSWTVRLAQLDQVIGTCLRRTAGLFDGARAGRAERYAATPR